MASEDFGDLHKHGQNGETRKRPRPSVLSPVRCITVLDLTQPLLFHAGAYRDPKVPGGSATADLGSRGQM
jgi:hypothetical protein